jgi:hypothetical protein
MAIEEMAAGILINCFRGLIRVLCDVKCYDLYFACNFTYNDGAGPFDTNTILS